MKKAALLAVLAAALLLSGCGSLFESEYYYSEPFAGSSGSQKGNATEIRNYNMLKSALVELINNHAEQGELRFSSYKGSVTDDLAAVCYEVKSSNPLGAYAVETLSYDTSRVVSYYTAEIHIGYKKTAEEIQNIVGVSTTAELKALLEDAVKNYAEETVLRAFSAKVTEDYIAQRVQEIYLSDPTDPVAEPTVSVTSYPGEGINRIYVVRLDYGYAPTVLQNQARTLERELETLTEGMDEAQPPEQLALECAGRLHAIQNLNEMPGPNGSTAYGAVVDRAADSKGIALAYKALCNAAGIDCTVVRGGIGAMGTEEHYWNIISLYGDNYHVDVSQFRFNPAYAFLLPDEALWGTYIWDTEDYPECSGALRYSDLVPVPENAEPEETPETEQAESEQPEQEDPEAPEETPGETEAPQESEAPEETEEIQEIPA